MLKKSFKVSVLFLFLINCFFLFQGSATQVNAGQMFPERVIGGVEAPYGAWPWMAYLDIKIENEEVPSFCGGSLINKNWILTAAHCSLNATEINATLGRHDLYTNEGEVIPVSKWYNFPAYDDEFTTSDIALLKLSRASNQTVIPVIGRDEPANLLSAGKNGTIAGWGNTIPSEYNYDKVSDVLLQVELPVIDDDKGIETMKEYLLEHWDEWIEGDLTPEEFFTEEFFAKVRETMFFAGYLYENKDAGGGDSGGPFMIKNNAGKWVLAGLVSGGFGDSAQGAYGAYTRVSTFSYWIDDMIKGSRIFNYLSDTFTDFVGPEKVESELIEFYDIPVHYRCYQSKQACLAITHGNLYYIGPESDNEFAPIGTIKDWMPEVEEAGY